LTKLSARKLGAPDDVDVRPLPNVWSHTLAVTSALGGQADKHNACCLRILSGFVRAFLPTTIPLNKLTAWEGNVRKTGAGDNLDELIASIAAHGLLQSLVVRKARRGKYAVIAGRRRLLALQALADTGKLAASMQVPCILIAEDANATELSLAENAIRLPMHPADTSRR
jgi:ParB-like nuclease family protein